MLAMAAASLTSLYNAGVVNIHDGWQVFRLCDNSSVFTTKHTSHTQENNASDTTWWC